jgi:hypothetical protein
VKAQFQQFASNALSPPEPIILGHLSDQGDRFGGDLGLVRKDLGLTLPIPTKELPMPAEQGLWLDNEQGLVPASNQPSSQHEEHPIRFGACWPFHLTLEDDELLS